MVMNRLWDHGRSERGGIVAFVALVPVLIVGLMALAQVAIIGHARHVATAAAEAGLAQARVLDGTAADGEVRALQQIARANGWVISGTADATRTATTATVVVRVEALQVFTSAGTSIEVERTGPVEGLDP